MTRDGAEKKQPIKYGVCCICGCKVAKTEFVCAECAGGWERWIK